MGIQGVITAIVDLLKLIPGIVLPVDHIGQSLPTRKQDLPAIVVSAGEIKTSLIGIGGTIIIQKDSEDQWIEKKGDRVSGSLFIDFWANNEAEIMEVANAVFQQFEVSKNQLREMGFIQFADKSIGPIETHDLDHQNAVKLATIYSIIYEDIKITGPDGAGLIREVKVEISNGFREEMHISE